MAFTPKLNYRGRPLVRCNKEIYYGNMSDPFVDVYIVDNSPGDGVADKIQVMLLSTDTTKAPQERVVKQSTKVGLYTALDFGCIWLERALRDAAGKK